MSARRLSWGALAALIGVGAACVSLRGFRCRDSSECDFGAEPGVCEDNGYCSYADPECESEQRYEARAGEMGGQCVPVAGGDGGSGDDTASDSSAADGDTAAQTDSAGGMCPSAACESYCVEYPERCDMIDAVYAYTDEYECWQQCMQWPAGAPGDDANDSVECRRNRLAAGGDNSFQRCAEAGPSGGGVCVSAAPPACSKFCSDFIAECGTSPWAAQESCVAECGQWYPGEIDGAGAHSVGCRRFYLDAAMAGDDPQGCAKAGPSGGGVCVLPACE